LHLLLLDHAFRLDLFDRALSEGSWNRHPIMAPPPIVYQRATVGMKIFNQIADGPSGGACAARTWMESN
jgi:hypothetical protein